MPQTPALICCALTCALIFSGCASQPKSDKRVQALQMKLKKQRSQLDDLKERNLVLEKRVHVKSVNIDEEGESIGAAPLVVSEPPTPLPQTFVTATPVKAPALPLKLPPKLASVTKVQTSSALTTAAVPVAVSVTSEKSGEHYLYSKILDSYRTKNSNDLQRATELLLKSYPDSVFADNAIYLGGLSSLEKGDIKSASHQFDQLLREYPRSNKVVAALFEKASIEKRAGHVREAKRSYLQLRDQYPGSPEAARVSIELKLLEVASAKHRET